MLLSASPLAPVRKRHPLSACKFWLAVLGENKGFTQRRAGPSKACGHSLQKRMLQGQSLLAEVHCAAPSFVPREATRVTYSGPKSLDSLEMKGREGIGCCPSRD